MRKIYSVTDEDGSDEFVCEGCLDDDMEVHGEVDPDCTCDVCGHHPLADGENEEND